jgi:hypothetical protein
LLTQVAYEHDEDFSSHLALLCHVCLLLVDHEEQLVAAAAQQLLINCLYSLSARHLELLQEEGQHVECLQVRNRTKALFTFAPGRGMLCQAAQMSKRSVAASLWQYANTYLSAKVSVLPLPRLGHPLDLTCLLVCAMLYCTQATHLIKYLQSMKGRRLWSYEDLVLGQQQQLHSATALAGERQQQLCTSVSTAAAAAATAG